MRLCRDRILSMSRAWVGRKGPGLCLVSILLTASCAALAGVQEPPKAQEPPRVQAPPAPRTIVLPMIVIAGAQATLAVLDSQGRLMPNIAVELSGGQNVMTNATGRALFQAPGEPGMLIAKIQGREVTASTPVVAPENPSPGSAASQSTPAGFRVRSYPHVLTIHDRFNVDGSGFRGAADADRVFLADRLCFVLASSPESLVVLPDPRVPIGQINLRVRVEGRDSGSLPVSAVLLELSGPPEAANAGADGKLILRAYGTAEKLAVEVRNGSPAVIQLSRGNLQRLETSGGEPNVAPVGVRFLAAGSYLVSARLVSAEASQPAAGLAQHGLLETPRTVPARVCAGEKYPCGQ